MDFLNMISNEFMDVIKQDSNMVVKGMAGSGKTTLLKARIQYLIEEKKVDPKQLMVFVFNKNQVKMIKNTFEDLEHVYEVNQYIQQLMKFYYDSKSFAVRKVYRDLSVYVQRGVKERLKINIGANEASEIYKLFCTVRNQEVDEAKRIALLKKSDYRFDLIQVYDAYTKLKDRKNVMDHEDMVEKITLILNLDKQFRTAVMNQYQYVLMDDVQECSTLVFNFLKLITQDKIVMYLGDEVALMSKRIPKENILSDLAKHLNQDILALTTNYRNNKTIFECANRFYTSDKFVVCANKETIKPKFKSFLDLNKLYDYALKKVSEDEIQTAFVYRNDAMAFPLVDLFEQQQVPYTYYGSLKTFKNHKLVKELNKIIRLILDPYNFELFASIYPVFQLEIPKRVIAEMEIAMNEDRDLDVYKALINSSLKQVMKPKVVALSNQMHHIAKANSLNMILFILDKIGYRHYLNKKQDMRNDAYLLAYEVLAQRYEDPMLLLERIETLEKTQPDSVSTVIASITQVYGEEYDRICVLDCVKTLFPINENSKQERNLFYYAISRAKKDIEFFTAKAQANRRLAISPFLFELNELLTKNTTASTPSKMIRITNLKKGVMIVHKQFGEGTIMKLDGEMLYVKFASEEKVMNAKVCIRNKLITLK